MGDEAVPRGSAEVAGCLLSLTLEGGGKAYWGWTLLPS